MVKSLFRVTFVCRLKSRVHLVVPMKLLGFVQMSFQEYLSVIRRSFKDFFIFMLYLFFSEKNGFGKVGFNSPSRVRVSALW